MELKRDIEEAVRSIIKSRKKRCETREIIESDSVEKFIHVGYDEITPLPENDRQFEDVTRLLDHQMGSIQSYISKIILQVLCLVKLVPE